MSGTSLGRIVPFGLQELTTRTVTASASIGAEDVLFVDASTANIAVTIPAALNVEGARKYIKRIDNNPDQFVYITSAGGIGGDDAHITLIPTTGHGQKSGEGVEVIYSEAAGRWEVLGDNPNTEVADYQRHLALGGTREFDPATNRINWTGRWLSIGNGYSPGGAEDNFINLTEPPAGTQIRVNAGPGTREWTATGLVLNDWETLSYDYEPNSGTGTDHTRWRIRNYNQNYQRSESEIVIAQKVGDTRDAIKWGDGVWSENSLAPDFWREAGTGLQGLPEGGQADETNDIVKRGKVGIGDLNQAPAWSPVAQLDVAAGNRSGSGAATNANAVFKATGNLPAGGTGTACNLPTSHLAGFWHSNQTQGVAFGYDLIYAAGNNANQDLGISTKGSGQHYTKWPTAAQPFDYRVGCTTAAVGRAFYDRDYIAGKEVSRVLRGYHEDAAGNETTTRWYQQHNGLRTAMRLQPSVANNTAFSLSISENDTTRDKLILYNQARTNAIQFMGLGVEGNDSGAVIQQTYSGWSHRTYNSDSATVNRLLTEVQANGRMSIGSETSGTKYNGAGAMLDVRQNAVIGKVTNQTNRNTATLANSGLTVFSNLPATGGVQAAQPVIRMVNEQVGGVAWGRTAEFRLGSYEANINSRSQLEIWLGLNGSWTPNVKVMHFRADGRINTAGLPVFANDAAAGALITGDWYRTPTGELRIKI